MTGQGRSRHGARVAGMALLLSLIATAAQAQMPGAALPDSCRQQHAISGWVIADCLGQNGTWRRTVLRDVDSCSAGLDNRNGLLTCGAGTAIGSGSSSPPPHHHARR